MSLLLFQKTGWRWMMARVLAMTLLKLLASVVYAEKGKMTNQVEPWMMWTSPSRLPSRICVASVSSSTSRRAGQRERSSNASETTATSLSDSLRPVWQRSSTKNVTEIRQHCLRLSCQAPCNRNYMQSLTSRLRHGARRA